MSFDISWASEPLPPTVPGERAAYGVIQIGDYTERFLASLDFWTRSDYLRQWHGAIDRIKQGHEKSALFTSISDPKYANFFTWWPMYIVDGTVYFQNALLFLDRLDEPFDLANPYKYVENRTTKTQDGSPVSEWSLEISEVLNAQLS
jgi:CdiI N-terminal domain